VGDHEDETQTLHLSALEFEIPLFETKPATLRKVEGMGEAKEDDGAAGGLEVQFRDVVSVFDVLRGGH
jgi:hypothetical protein